MKPQIQKDLQECIGELGIIAKILDNLEYECVEGLYTFTDDEMCNIFLCRSIAEALVKKHKKK
jgi:hypothetical protein